MPEGNRSYNEARRLTGQLMLQPALRLSSVLNNDVTCCCCGVTPRLVQGYDFFQSVTKLRQAGFSSMKLDSTDMWLEWLKKLDRLAVFPPVTAQAASNAQHSGVGKERAKGAAEAPAAPQIVPA